MMKKIILLFASLMMSACVHPPKGLEREIAEILFFNKISEQGYSCVCKRVRLGGKVLKATALKEKMELEILSLPVSLFSAKPILDSNSDGRFLAYIDGFIDPESLNQQYITVSGRLIAKQAGKIDQADYNYPVIQVESYRKWQLSQQVYYDPQDWADFYEDRRMGWGYSIRPEPRIRQILR